MPNWKGLIKTNKHNSDEVADLIARQQATILSLEQETEWMRNTILKRNQTIRWQKKEITNLKGEITMLMNETDSGVPERDTWGDASPLPS